MTHTARLRRYVADLPAGSMLTSARVADVLDITQSAAWMALRRLAAQGLIVRSPWPERAVAYITNPKP